jgi:hypothetical protein
MRLGVPRSQVQDVVPTLRFGLVKIWITLRERTEEFAPLPPEVKPVSRVESVASFVS